MSAPRIAELTRVFLKIGFLSFGGPAAQIALMQRELVDERPWLTERQFLNAVGFCMLLPGPEAMQIATYCGWKLSGVRGGLIAGGLFVLPGAAIVLLLAAAYASYGEIPLVRAVFLGVQAAVVAIVLQALLRLANKTLKLPSHWLIAGLSFLAIYVFALPFPLIILAAGLWGAFAATGAAPPPLPVTPAKPLKTLTIGLSSWFLPILVLWGAGASFLTDIAVFFSILAVVTFGGAYAVLAYMTQEVVATKGWITTQAMIDALGLAETTPGPLILVTEFVAYLAGAVQGGPGLAVAAALVALWVTFVPCFLWVFLGAPYIDWIASRPRLTGALNAITAAVVGVILNLSVWFALHVFFANVRIAHAGPMMPALPDWSSFQLLPAALALVAGVLLIGLRWPLIRVLAVSGGLSLLISSAL